MKYQPTRESFLEDVAKHEMSVLLNNDVHRHVRFRKPDTINMSFAITTWPGYLCISGDMGCYVFTRLWDMFEFFRSSREGKDGINLYYWGEKVEAVDRCSAVKEYSPDLFRESIWEWVKEYEGENGCDQNLRNSVQHFIILRAEDGHQIAVGAALDFQHEGKYVFADFYEVTVKEVTHRFVWCCRAISWAIEQFDLKMTSVESAVPA